VAAGVYNLCIDQGATYAKIFAWVAGSPPKPVDITGYTANMQIRPFPLSTTLLYDASADLTLGGPCGTIGLTIDATDTESFDWLQAVYDLLLTSPAGLVSRFIGGSISVSDGVTP
jgi:hypothetical protein